jgi:hypothetical protein
LKLIDSFRTTKGNTFTAINGICKEYGFSGLMFKGLFARIIMIGTLTGKQLYFFG